MDNELRSIRLRRRRIDRALNFAAFAVGVPLRMEGVCLPGQAQFSGCGRRQASFLTGSKTANFRAPWRAGSVRRAPRAASVGDRPRRCHQGRPSLAEPSTLRAADAGTHVPRLIPDGTRRMIGKQDSPTRPAAGSDALHFGLAVRTGGLAGVRVLLARELAWLLLGNVVDVGGE